MPRPPAPSDPIPDSQKLSQLIGLEVKTEFVYYLADSVVDAVVAALSKEPTALIAVPLARARVPHFEQFALNFIRNTPLGMPALLVALVYITRAKPFLRIEWDEWTFERVFMGALIVALKYTIDAVPETDLWVRATATPEEGAFFTKQDVDRIEREFLAVLDWELGFTEEDILLHHPAIIELYGLTKNDPPICISCFLQGS